MRDKIYINDDGGSPLFSPRPTWGSIKKSYAGTPPTFFDGWLYPTLDDLTMPNEAPHKDYEQVAFLRAGWLK